MKGLMIVLGLVAVVAVARADSLNCREVGACTLNYGLAVAVDPGRNLAYLGSWSEVSVLDIANPAHPTKHSRVEASGGIEDVCPMSDRLYIPECVYGLLEVWDVADPKLPVRLNDYPTGGFPNGVRVAGSYAYVADGVANLLIIDVSDPESLHEEGRCNTPGAPGRVAVAGSYAYVTLGEAGLIVIDVSNPQNPHGEGRCNTPGNASGVAVAGSYAYVADYDAGLRIIDVSNPQSSHEEGHYDTPGIAALGVAVAGSYAYVADYDAGLRVIDVSNPQNPAEAGYYDTPGYARGVDVAGRYAYVADDEAGLRIIEFYGGGVEETPSAELRTPNVPTIVRSSLCLPQSPVAGRQSPSALLDITGRKVLDLHPGANDVSRLAPGVYFVRKAQAQAVRKVIISR